MTLFFSQLRAGNADAAEALWQRFFPRLVALARKTLAGRPQRMADASDAAQSAFASFCQRVRGGEVHINDRSDLWNLLGITRLLYPLSQAGVIAGVVDLPHLSFG